jgi:hypothetical protein
MRSLKLNKETLTELSTQDLASVVGGLSGQTCPVTICVTTTSNQQGCFTWSCWTGTSSITG